MAIRRSPALTGPGVAASAKAGDGDAPRARQRHARPSVYTAQALANFCEVDLKTVHHWAEKGKVPHFRTEGRHLRFRRNDLVRFLRGHGYPLPGALVRARPTVAMALSSLDHPTFTLDDLVKKLGSRFSVQRWSGAVPALAHLVSEAPDVLVLSTEDPAIVAGPTVAALKADPATSWILLATIGEEHAKTAVRDAGADITLVARDAAKLAQELARALAIV